MSTPRLPLRLVLLLVAAVAALLAVGLLVATANSVLEFYQRIVLLPLWLRLPLAIAASLLLLGLGWLFWRLARPAPASPLAVPAPRTREEVDARVSALRERQAETAGLEAELAELDRRQAGGELYVALFGEISAGKSSLLRALAPEAHTEVDVRGGTTTVVSHHRGRLPDGRELVLADLPGSGEVDGAAREQLARDEALRAHAVLYLVSGDLGRAQHAELAWLARFGKPLLLVLNKADQYAPAERDALLARLRGLGLARDVVAISAGGHERFERVLPDGRRETVERERLPEVAPLLQALGRLVAPGTAGLEPAREAAVLAEVGRRGDELARATAAREAEAAVRKYTHRAIVGALAAIAPGTDILIQGALGTGLVRELARIHGVAVRELDVEALLQRIGLTVRSTTAIVLAIAGNALKAFPGLGTVGGGLLHAVAYGLVFDSLGHALAATLAEHARLDAGDVETRVRALLGSPARERVERIARIALAARSTDRPPGPERTEGR